MEFLAPQTAELRQARTRLLQQAVTDPSARSQINSGKLAEPYWYTASSLTTPGPSLVGFPVEPGALRPPVPGVLCPDSPCDRVTPAARLRQLFGRSFVVLTSSPAAADSAAEIAAASMAAESAAAGEEVSTTKLLPNNW